MKNMKTRSLALFICNVSIIAMVLVPFTFMVNIPEARAATCSITGTETVNAAYVSSNSCTAIDLAGTFVVTWDGAIDLGGGTVTVSSGTVTFSGAMDLGASDDFVVASGATVTHAASDNTGVQIDARDVTLVGDIDTSEKGCAGAVNTGASSGPNTSTGVCAPSTSGYGYTNLGGGSHAGIGGKGNVSVEQVTIYDDTTNPALLGSGGGAGGSNMNGGNGGGRVIISASGTLTVTGDIVANGGNGYGAGNQGGGGSGGAILINASVLGGSGDISTDGGNGHTNYSGGGGGGRVSVSYATTTYPLANITANKGSKSSGTPGNSTDGSVGTTYIIDTTADTLTVSTGLEMQDGDDYTRSNITFLDGADIWCDVDGFSTLTVGASSIFAFDDTDWTCDTVDVINFSAGTWTTSGTNTVLFNKAGAQVDWAITNNLELNNLTYTGGYAGVVSASGGLLTLDDAIDVSLVNTDIYASVDWDVVSLTLDGTSSISAQSKGCQGGVNGSSDGYGPNTGTGVCTQTTSGYGKTYLGGAAHAGTGGRGHSTANSQTTTYGDSASPTLFGSGGSGGSSANTNGGYGGGKIFLDVSGILSVAGDINADGGDGYGSGARAAGASGGSVNIATGTLSGAGTISADGGNGNTDYSGGGGGGRVAVLYSNASGFTLGNIVSVLGENSSGTPGNATDGTAGTVSLTDLGPSISTAVTDDDDGDGQIDRIVLAMTEDVESATVAGADFTLSDSYTVASASRTADSQITIVVTEKSNDGDTEVVPTVTIAGSIDDTSANSTTSGSKASTDGAKP
ncbi:hypothetical protein HN699_01210, partial [Candidatus Uhrbacteria bacterium]|nr:hypothetical protein [Candidatus Uhrbacteria bacterium]